MDKLRQERDALALAYEDARETIALLEGLVRDYTMTIPALERARKILSQESPTSKANLAVLKAERAFSDATRKWKGLVAQAGGWLAEGSRLKLMEQAERARQDMDEAMMKLIHAETDALPKPKKARR